MCDIQQLRQIFTKKATTKSQLPHDHTSMSILSIVGILKGAHLKKVFLSLYRYLL